MKRLVLALFSVASFTGILGQSISAFELQQMNGDMQVYKTSDHPTGIFVVEAYFLGCHFCNENAPYVNELAEKYSKESRVQVLDVGVDRSDEDYATWIDRHHPNHPVLKDDREQVISQLGTSAYPSTYVLDCKGNVAYESVGSWGSDEKRGIEEAINKLLKGACSVQAHNF